MSDFFNQSNNDYTFLDFRGGRCGGRTRFDGETEFSLSVSRHLKSAHTRSSTYRVAFSPKVSAIVSKKRLTHFRIRRDNITGECHVIFLKDVNDKCGRVTYEPGESKQVRMYNKLLCNFFAERLNLKGSFDIQRFQLSDDLSNSNEYATFKIIKHISYES